MDTSQLKRYAIQARREFISAVAARAKRIGTDADGVADYQERGDFLILGEQKFPIEYKGAFAALRQAIYRKGFDHVIDEVAYTWFNRFVALRYMELHDYLPHGMRVLSSRDSNSSPEIMRDPTRLDFSSDVNKEVIRELFEAGNREEELYRTLLIAQCNELNAIMPFLFEKVSALSELLLPDNLLSSDSIIRNLCSEIAEDEWQKGVEIIGWIYQFYISEKKDEVIGKVVKPEDIPAATQLFTPNWIVKYLVQNSVGSYWLGTYPDSPLKAKMEYYIEPAKQEPEVEEELKKITPKEIDPETITVIDPACGSGHILVEAYNVLKEIYLERGYRPREVPRLILEKNLFGLDIDERAAQLASLALLLRARADDRSIFSSDHPVQLNILELVEPDFKVEEAAQMLTGGKNIPVEQIAMPFIDTTPKQGELSLTKRNELTPHDVKQFFELFTEAKTFGSLIQIPAELQAKLSTIEQQAEKLLQGNNLFEKPVGVKTKRLVHQARMLAGRYDACVMNPPYMGGRFFASTLRGFVQEFYRSTKMDLFAAFMERGTSFVAQSGFSAQVVMQSWMFLSSLEEFRKHLLRTQQIRTLLHMGNGVMRIAFGTSAVIFRRNSIQSCKGVYTYVEEGDLDVTERPSSFPCLNSRTTQSNATNGVFIVKQSELSLIPGSPIAYWVSDRMRQVFREGTPLGEIAEPRQGLATGSNERFLRRWYELSVSGIGFDFQSLALANSSQKKWFPYNKGGEYRKWYGNLSHVVNWKDDGSEIRNFTDLEGNLRSRPQNTSYYFREGLTWTLLSSSYFGVRFSPSGSIFDINGMSLFVDDDKLPVILGLMGSKVATHFLRVLNPTLAFQVGDIKKLPIVTFPSVVEKRLRELVQEAVGIAKQDWSSFETFWQFQQSPLVGLRRGEERFKDSYFSYQQQCLSLIDQLRIIETEINRLYIEAFQLSCDLDPEVVEEDIILYRPSREDDTKIFCSYAVGCMMGRYSLDTPGLIYAHSGNEGFDPSRYTKFPADSDGIIPLMDHPWFEDDATARFISFLEVAWSEETLADNLKFVADSLEPKSGETPEETIQRYFSDSFFKDHVKTYKNRPIYWLFSSGKQGAFQALVYLHRYNEGTLSRMRTDYVLPLQSKLSNEERRLETLIETASSPAERNRQKKALEKLKKKSIELRAFDEKLHHLADQRIKLDLDDGVRVNYAKLAPLLAGVKEVTGGAED
jgi:hypothetical protein